MADLDYVSVDKYDNFADYRMDITDLHLKSESFDCLLCLHVLEHIPDDLQALREMRRVLKPGAWALIGVPIDHARATTFENPHVTSDEERRKIFGQKDHVRVYGRDIARRIKQAGFDVVGVDYCECLGSAEREKYGIIAGEEFFSCKRIST